MLRFNPSLRRIRQSRISLFSTSAALLEQLGKCSTQSVVDALWVMGYPQTMIEGARPLSPGTTAVGNAVTVRFVPFRPDIAMDKPSGAESPEYQAFEECGPNDILVMSSVGPWESIGGGIKLLRLAQREVAGIVTDGSVRDSGEVQEYGLKVWSHSSTAKQGPATMVPWAHNEVISCGGVAVRPGDAILADQDGVVVVPESKVQQVVDIAREREQVESIVVEELKANPQSPGNLYPFKTPIPKSSALYSLLEKRNPTLLRNIQSRGYHSSTRAATSHMRAAVIRENGGPSVIKTEGNVEIPELNDGECLVENEFAGLNFIDTYHRSGLYKRDLPFIGGQEGAGRVVKVTPKAAELGMKEGDKVAYTAFQSYAEYTPVSASKLIPVPEGVGLDVATALVVQGMTAHYLTVSAHADLIKPGEWMLIHSIGAGTGQWAAQMAKILGYKVIGTTSKRKADLARSTGVDELVVLNEVPGKKYSDYSDSAELMATISRVTDGQGVKCVLDGVGKSSWELSIDALANRGIVVFFGNASGPVPDVPPFKLLQKSAYMTRPTLLHYTSTREELLWRAQEVFSWYQSGQLRVNVDRVFGLDECQEAHRYIEAGETRGKVVIACK